MYQDLITLEEKSFEIIHDLKNENLVNLFIKDEYEEIPLFKQEDRSRIFSSVLGRSAPDKYELAELKTGPI